MTDWSNLPTELLNCIAFRLFSLVELKRFRSICKSWRYSVSGTGNNIPFPSRPLIQLNPMLDTSHFFVYSFGQFLSRVAFFRLTLSSSTSKGWLIKSDVDINSGRFRLLHPLTYSRLHCSFESLDLVKFTVSQIREAPSGLSTSVVVKVKEGEELRYGVLGVSCVGNISYWNGNVLRKLQNTDQYFYDIIVHKGVTCALDSQGIVWRIHSDLEISRYGSSLNENSFTNVCFGDLRFVDCFGELYIVKREKSITNGSRYNPQKRKVQELQTYRTSGFRVYKMDDDEEVGKLIEVKSLGDNAFVMAEETCFSVLAHEFYGCLKNSIYFTEDKVMKVFKLDNGSGSSIITNASSESCFEMFDLLNLV